MREREGHDLAGVTGVGQDFLIARDGRIEANFANGLAGCAEAATFNDGAVGEDKAGGLVLSPGWGPGFGPSWAPVGGRRIWLRWSSRGSQRGPCGGCILALVVKRGAWVNFCCAESGSFGRGARIW